MNPLLRLTVPFLLASQSPRRRALLDQIDVEFRALVSPAEETISDPTDPPATVQTLARQKARPVSADHPAALVLTADTLVVHEGTLLGKPNTPQEAREMLRQLSDTTHTVYTGIALFHKASNRAASAVGATHVTFGSLTTKEIDAYVETGSPLDKAGSYGIQDHTGSLFVERLEGDYYNVVGLPLRRLYLLLRREFSDLLADE